VFSPGKLFRNRDKFAGCAGVAEICVAVKAAIYQQIRRVPRWRGVCKKRPGPTFRQMAMP